MPTLKITASVGLGGKNKLADAKAVQQRLIDLGFTWLKADGSVGPTTISAIRLFQAMKNGLNTVSNLKNDGLVEPNGETIKWLNAVNAPRWQQMTEKGDGFVNFEVQDKGDNHDFGSSWLDEALVAAGRAYSKSWLVDHPNDTPLTINDTSVPRGGNTPSHAGHEAGMACDIRLPRTDGKAGGGITTDHSKYDRDAMRAQIRAFLKQKVALRVFLIDPILNGEGLCMPVTGHRDHAHFEIKPPIRVDPGED